MARTAIQRANVEAPPSSDDIMGIKRTPAREKLADAIATVAMVEADIVETSAAVTQTKEDYYASIRVLDDAQRTLERAKPREDTFSPGPKPRGAFWAGQVDYEAAEAEAAIPPIPIAEAKAAVEAATDAKDSAKRLHQFHKDRLDQLQSQLVFKRSLIGDAVRGVVREDPALAALAIESKRLATLAAAAAMAFDLATNGDVIQSDSPFYRYDKPSDFKADFDGWAVSRAWREALEQLKTNPDVPLPA